jgi:hypothetical protein
MAPSKKEKEEDKRPVMKKGQRVAQQQAVFSEHKHIFEEPVVDEDDPVEEEYPRTHVCVPKVLAVVRKHQQINHLTGSFIRYLIFIAIYITVVTVQRDAEPSESVQAAVRNYMFAAWRDPDTLTIKSFKDIRTVSEFWDWVDTVNGNLMVQSYEDGTPLGDGNAQTLLQHNRLTGTWRLVQRRVKGRDCTWWQQKYSLFFPKERQRPHSSSFHLPRKLLEALTRPTRSWPPYCSADPHPAALAGSATADRTSKDS